MKYLLNALKVKIVVLVALHSHTYFFLIQTLFQLAKDFHRRSLCAISLLTFFKFYGQLISMDSLVLLVLPHS